ncbi:LacI family DNA-binding transcriptional regulator [Pedobacter nanyangensis]|uniref:LacI family DNA-binding transcriptional regulator n=1 Tax=Pedobacter nanyangensis TaxID=1562389 RepID=UPI000DE35857|nr:LacI family DNA-binding transcriptional regulator [Pedobacter nanyangensis]
MRKTTIKQLAQELQLSTSTISRALSDNYQISQKTKERVKRHAMERRYTVNRYAKSLREGSTKTIGVVICAMDKPFMAQVLNGIYDGCNQAGYQFLVMQSKGSFNAEKECVERLLHNGIDGLLISPSFNTFDLSYLVEQQAKGLPMVLFDRISHQIKTHQVAVDNFLGAQTSAEYLLKKGMKRILVIGCLEEVWLSRERVDGFLSTMEQLAPGKHLCEVVNVDPTCKEQLTQQLEKVFVKHLKEQHQFDAIFATTDTFTTTAIRCLQKLRIDIPLVGFCNSELADILLGNPTRIVQPAYQVGMAAVGQLLELIRHPGQTDFETIYLPTKLEEGIGI